MRRKYIDGLKGLAILLVVMGHLFVVSGLDQSVPQRFIYLFHMPLFFFLSGLVTKDVGEQRSITWIVKKVKAVFVPFAVWSCLLMIFNGLTPPEVLFDFMKLGLWYLWTLMGFYLFHCAFSKIQHLMNRSKKIWKDLVLFAVIYLIVKLIYRYTLSWEDFHALVGTLHWICYLPFFYVGTLFNKYRMEDWLVRNTDKVFPLVVLFVAGGLYLMFAKGVFGSQLAMVVAFSICVVLLRSFMHWEKLPFMEKIAMVGPYTLQIYCIHYFLLPYSNLGFLFRPLMNHHATLLVCVTAALLAVLITGLSVVVGRMLSVSKPLSKILFGR